MRNIVAVTAVLAIIIIAVLVFVPIDEDRPAPPETVSELSEPADTAPSSEVPEPAAADDTQDQTAAVAPETAAEPADAASEPRVVPREDIETAEDPATTPSADQEVATLTEEAAEPVAEPGAAEPVAPTFDVVRIDQGGRAVIAGRAEPGAEVSVRVDREVVATVTADGRGEWVVLPDQPLASGPAEFDLSATAEGASPVLSESVVVVDVPDRAPRAVATETPEPEMRPDEVATARESGTAVEDERRSAATEATSPEAPVETAALDPASEDEARAPIELESGDEGALRLDAGAGDAAPVQTEALAVLMPREGEGPIKVLQGPVSGEAGLRLEIIDYDTEGNIVLSGSATPGTTVRAYVDDTAVGVARSSEGTWQLVPEGDVAVGRHALRVEEVSEAGTITGSFEMPFSRAAPDDIQLTAGQVIVQPGNSLWRIARRAYGRGVRFTIIYLANRDQIGDPDLIYPGQVFTLPRTE